MSRCRRCNTKDFTPSKADPVTCETCAEEYTTYGRKYCKGCDKWPYTSAFSRGKARCKPCIAAYERERYQRNPEPVLARMRARYQADPEAARAERRAQWQKHRDKRLEYLRTRYRRLREQRNADQRAWYWKNHESELERRRTYHAQRGRMLRRLKQLQAVRGGR